jgi:flagellar FliJ protein
MVRSKRLLPIKKLAQNKEKQAAQALGESLQNQQLEKDKLEQLQRYQNEYLIQMQNKVKQGVSGSVLYQYHQFLNKIKTAIEQQENVVRGCADELSSQQNHWRNKHSETEVISQVIHNMADQEKRNRNKQEVKQSDEMSTQAYLRRQKNFVNH